MKKTCYLFVFDGFADYETSLATAGISKSKLFQVKTIGITKEPVKTISGATIAPDLDFKPEVDLVDIDNENTGILILPGEEKINPGISLLLDHCVMKGIPVAAICGATVLLADHGFLDNIEHTSNSFEYLDALSTDYNGQAFYRYQPSVRTTSFITASGAASVEFARDVFDCLGISDEQRVNDWFQYFHHAVA